MQKFVPRGHGHQQRRPLHAAVPLALGGGHAGLDGLGRDLELLPGLRGGGLPHGGRRRRLGQPSRSSPIRFRRAVSRGARLIVVNPKRIELCDQADLWIRQRPGTDVALFNAMARVILDEGLADHDVRPRAHRGLRRVAGARWSPTRSSTPSGVTGVPADDIAQAARWYARPPFAGSCLIWGMGITQHINGTAQRPRAAEPLAGRRADGLPGLRHLAAARPEQRPGLRRRRLHPDQPARLPALRRRRRSTRFERAWGVRPPGRTGPASSPRWSRAASTGDVRAMYVVGENPLLSEPDLHHAEKAIEPARLPGRAGPLHARDGRARPRVPARGRLRREGRHVHQLRAARAARAPGPAAARPGAARLVDHRRAGQAGRRAASGSTSAASSTTPAPAEIFDEMARLCAVPGRACPTRGWTARAGCSGPARPRPPGHALPLRRVVPAGQGALRPGRRRPPRRPSCPTPTTRSCSTPAGCSTTGTAARSRRRVQGLLELAPRLEIALHPADARRLGVDDGGAAAGGLAARRADRLRPGDRGRAAGRGLRAVREARDSAANFLTNSAADPSSKIPEYKVCAVRLEPLP